MSSTLVQLSVLVVTPGVAGVLVALPIVLRVKPRPVRIPNYVVPLPPKHIAAHQASRKRPAHHHEGASLAFADELRRINTAIRTGRPSYMAEVSQ